MTITIITLLVFSIVCSICQYARKGEKRAVFLLYAYAMQWKDDYYIVGRFGKYDEGTEIYYYLDGFTKKPVRITGNSPYHAIDIGMLPHNIFLIKGNLNEAMANFLGVDILVAESWDIIAPIQRSKEKTGRILAPWWYIDEYDLAVGAYKEIDEKCRPLDYWEEEWLRYIWADECLTVTAEIVNEEVQWYVVEGDVRWDLMSEKDFAKVQLGGCTPELYYQSNMSKVEAAQILNNKKVYFLVHGNRDESGVFWVNEWHVLSQLW